MSLSLATFDLLNHESGEILRLDLVEGLTRQHLDFVSNEWSPRLKASRDRAAVAFRALPEKKRNEQMWQEKQGLFGAPDSHWDWDEKCQTMIRSVHRMLGLLKLSGIRKLFFCVIKFPIFCLSKHILNRFVQTHNSTIVLSVPS